MRVPLSWLREMVDFDLEPEDLAARLTLLGMEVKGIERRGSDWQNVVVGELLAVEKHPRADRLSLTRVSERRSAFGCFSTPSSSPTTTFAQSLPRRSMPLTSIPSRVRRSASCSGDK